jgi:hypothetical protein
MPRDGRCALFRLSTGIALLRTSRDADGTESLNLILVDIKQFGCFEIFQISPSVVGGLALEFESDFGDCFLLFQLVGSEGLIARGERDEPKKERNDRRSVDVETSVVGLPPADCKVFDLQLSVDPHTEGV